MTRIILAVLIFSLAQTVLLSEEIKSSIKANSTSRTSPSDKKVDKGELPSNKNGTSPSDKKVDKGELPSNKNGTSPSDKKVDEGELPSNTNGTSPSDKKVDEGELLSNKNGTSPSDIKVDEVHWEFLNLKNLTLEHGITFAAGAGLSAIVCSACCCVIGLCSRRNRRKRRDEDKEYPGAALTMVASVDRQRSGSPGLAEDEQAPLHAGGEQGEGGAAGGANADVDYATIDVSQLKKREAADEPGPGADTDYAEIRKERKGGGDRVEGEGEGGEEAAAAGEEGAAENLGAVQQECADAGEQG